MFLFVGLGNPGDKYDETPHNAGFLFLDKFREFLGWDSLYSVDDWKDERPFESQIASVRVGADIRAKLVKPSTFVNLSGRAVGLMVRKFELKPAQSLVLIHDDLDIKLGEYKIQRGKGPKGHNGISSVHSAVGTTDFLRVRIGVDNREKTNQISGEEYVLRKMNEEERVLFDEVCIDAMKSLRSIVQI